MVNYLAKSKITNAEQIDARHPCPRIICASGWDYPDNCPEKNKQWMVISIPFSNNYEAGPACMFQLWMSEYGDIYKRSWTANDGSSKWTAFSKIS